MCRLCMGRSNLIHSVLENNLLQKIAICVSIMINPSDTLFPMELCALCVLKVQDFFEFRQNCLKVQQLLEQRIETQIEDNPPAQPVLAVKEEKVEKPSAKPSIEIPQITKLEVILDEEEELDCLNESPELEEVSIVETDVDRTIEELEEIPDEDVLMDDLVEQDDVIFEADSVAETEQEQESEAQTTEDRSMDYHIEMIEFNFAQNPQENELEEQADEGQESPIQDVHLPEVEKNESNPELIEHNLQEFEEVSVKDTTSSSFFCRAKARKKYNGPKPPKPNLSEKEIYQSLLQTCDTCGKSVERNRMEGHRNRHLDVRPYICGVESCGMAFHCKISLRLHTKSRHGTEQLHCDLCGKSYTSRKALYHHKKESHAEKHYACEECGLVFVSNARLNRHKVTHTDQREFKCPHCPKEFYRSNNLKVHLRSHTKEKPFGCLSCDKAFGYQRLLREHVNRHH